MLTFKVRQDRRGSAYEITRDNYERYAVPMKDYVRVKGGKMSYYAVCPFCDNPITIRGLYKETEGGTRPYGSHYPGGFGRFRYDAVTMEHCAAYTGKTTADRNGRYESMRPLNYEVYQAVQENFPSAVYILGQVLGVYVGRSFAEKLLRNYLASEGFLYYEAAVYNIPWMLLYLAHMQVPLYRKLIRRDSFMYEFVRDRKDAVLVPYRTKEGEDTEYEVIEKAGRFLDLRFDMYSHRRRLTDGGALRETIKIRICTRDWNSVTGHDEAGKPIYGDKEAFSCTVPINEFRFPNLINSENKRTDGALEEIAHRLMPSLPGPTA